MCNILKLPHTLFNILNIYFFIVSLCTFKYVKYSEASKRIFIFLFADASAYFVYYIHCAVCPHEISG